MKLSERPPFPAVGSTPDRPPTFPAIFKKTGEPDFTAANYAEANAAIAYGYRWDVEGWLAHRS